MTMAARVGLAQRKADELLGALATFTTGTVHARGSLGFGLMAVLQREDVERLRLWLVREDRPVSADEIEVCREVFGAPVGTEPTRKSVRLADHMGRVRKQQVVELVWRES